SNRPDHHLSPDRAGAADDETRDQNMIAGLDETAGAQVEERVHRWFDRDKLGNVKATCKNGGLGSIRCEAESGTAAMIGLDQVAGIIKGQSIGDTQSCNETALHSRGCKFENGVRTGVCFKDVSGTIDGQSRGEAQ